MKVNINTLGVEFSFDVKLSGSERVSFYRDLYGYKNYSNYGKYVYIKDGVLSDMKYLKPTKSTIIVSIRDAKVLRKFFKQRNAVFNEKIVFLNKYEARKLGFKFGNDLNKIYEELKGNENLFFSVDV